jgi:hypothetical protein
MKKFVIAIAAVAVLVPATLAVFGVVLDQTTITTHAAGSHVHEIVVTSDSGNVDLIPGGSEVQVQETKHYVFKRPTVQQHLSGGVLTLDSHCDGIGFDCQADLRVTVPAGTPIHVDADSGDVHVDGVDVREAHVRSDSGDVRLDLQGRQSLVWAHSDSGKVHLDTAAARVIDAQADSGDVAVFASAAPRRTVAHADSGKVNLTLPPSAYAVNATSDSGDVDVARGIARNDRARNSIDAHSDSGDVRLRSG